jgi:hypothetical protein
MSPYQNYAQIGCCVLCSTLLFLNESAIGQNPLDAGGKRMDTFEADEFIKNSHTSATFFKVTIVPGFDKATGTFKIYIDVPSTIAIVNFYKCNFEGISIHVEDGATEVSIRSCVGIRTVQGSNGLNLDLREGTEVGDIRVDGGRTMIVGEASTVKNSITIDHSSVDGLHFKGMNVHGLYVTESAFLLNYLVSAVDAKGPWVFGKLDIASLGDTLTNPDHFVLPIKQLPVNYHYFSIRLEDSSIDEFVLDKCRFEKEDSFGTKPKVDDFSVLAVSNCKLGEVSFLNSQLPDLDFYGTSINKSLSMVGSTLGRMGCLFFDLPDNNVNGLPFEKLKNEKIFLCERIVGKLKTYPTRTSKGEADSVLTIQNRQGGYNTIPYVTVRPYLGSTSEDLRDSTLYDELINVHSKFLKLYRDRGDIVSANACYIETKRIEGKKLKMQYEDKPSLQNYFGHTLNRFLYAFSDYGTNPVKSMIYAFYVMLIFSIFYCLFPSEPDNLMAFRVYSFFNGAVEYFKTSKQLAEFHRENRKHEIEALEGFATVIRDSKRTIPAIVWWLGTPLYKIAIGYNKTIVWLLGKTDVVRGRWQDLNKRKRLWLGILVGLLFVSFLLAGLFMRILNGLALSLNAFITLGYGEISAKGVARYLAVVEGVFGWFLLSIFSVSLISQILN